MKFSVLHRFWRVILVKSSVSDTQTLQNVACGKFHAKFHATTEKNGEEFHSALLQGIRTVCVRASPI